MEWETFPDGLRQRLTLFLTNLTHNPVSTLDKGSVSQPSSLFLKLNFHWNQFCSCRNRLIKVLFPRAPLNLVTWKLLWVERPFCCSLRVLYSVTRRQGAGVTLYLWSRNNGIWMVCLVREDNGNHLPLIESLLKRKKTLSNTSARKNFSLIRDSSPSLSAWVCGKVWDKLKIKRVGVKATSPFPSFSHLFRVVLRWEEREGFVCYYRTEDKCWGKAERIK